MIQRIDQFIGAHVFVPFVIRVCQAAGIGQWRFHNYGWMVASWLLLYAALLKDPSAAGLLLVLSFWLTWRAGKTPDREGYNLLWLRIFLLAMEAMHLTEHVSGINLPGVGSNFDPSCPAGLILLACEYAATIKTIPPREERQGSLFDEERAA